MFIDEKGDKIQIEEIFSQGLYKKQNNQKTNQKNAKTFSEFFKIATDNCYYFLSIIH